MTLADHYPGHNFGEPQVDAVGLFYIIFIAHYTLSILVCCMFIFLLRKRLSVRLRHWGLTVLAVCSLHVYLAAVFIVYPLNGDYTCSEEFWYMSVVFPLALAIFQVSNIRLLVMAKVHQTLYLFPGTKVTRKLWIFRYHDTSNRLFGKTLVGVVAAFIFQVEYVLKPLLKSLIANKKKMVVTFILFYGSRRFNPLTGWFGTFVSPGECRRGAEWIPSIIWQFVWSWIIGPILLFKTRDMADTHGWALQTRVSIYSSLLGPPLWLTFLYLDGPVASRIGARWPQPFWFVPGLIGMQIATLMIPLCKALLQSTRQIKLKKRSRQARRTSSPTEESLRTSVTIRRYARSREAMEQQMAQSDSPFSLFVVYKFMSFESVLFCRTIAIFRVFCSQNKSDHELFVNAAHIHFALVNPTTAEMPINIPSHLIQELRDFFGLVTWVPTVKVSPTTLPAKQRVNPPSYTTVAYDNRHSLNDCVREILHRGDVIIDPRMIIPPVASWGEMLFRAADDHVREMLFTDAWPKFVGTVTEDQFAAIPKEGPNDAVSAMLIDTPSNASSSVHSSVHTEPEHESAFASAV